VLVSRWKYVETAKLMKQSLKNYDGENLSRLMRHSTAGLLFGA